MSSHSASYRKKAEVRVREVPEMEFCLAYVPAHAELYRLNPAAWFVLRMCEERTQAQITGDYHEAMTGTMSMQECRREVHAGIVNLVAMGIIEPVERTPGKNQK